MMLVFFLPLVSCGQKNDSLEEELKTLYRKTVPIISMEDATKAKGVRLLDTRESEEYAVSHLPNATFVGYDDFDLRNVSNIPKQDTIIVYCSVGYRSERIGEKLKKAGYKHVYNLYGGIFHWKNNHGIVVDSKNDTTEKVHVYNKSWGRFLTRGEKVY